MFFFLWKMYIAPFNCFCKNHIKYLMLNVSPSKSFIKGDNLEFYLKILFHGKTWIMIFN